MTVFLGDDWAEDHHDVYLLNEDGKKLAGRRLPEASMGSGCSMSSSPITSLIRRR